MQTVDMVPYGCLQGRTDVQQSQMRVKQVAICHVHVDQGHQVRGAVRGAQPIACCVLREARSSELERRASLWKYASSVVHTVGPHNTKVPSDF